MVKVGAMGKEPCCDIGSATFLRKANTAGKHIPALASTERFGVKSDTENDTGLYCSVTLISGTSDKHSYVESYFPFTRSKLVSMETVQG